MMMKTLWVVAVAAATIVVPATAPAQSADRRDADLRAIKRVHRPCNSWACVRRVRHARNQRAIRRHHNECRSWACVRRVERAKARRATSGRVAVVRPYRAWLESVAACESGGNWAINTGNGFFGGVQFTLQSWYAVGGRGYPHQASKLEQMYRAVLLMRLQGRGAWPVCG